MKRVHGEENNFILSALYFEEKTTSKNKVKLELEAVEERKPSPIVKNISSGS